MSLRHLVPCHPSCSFTVSDVRHCALSQHAANVSRLSLAIHRAAKTFCSRGAGSHPGPVSPYAPSVSKPLTALCVLHRGACSSPTLTVHNRNGGLGRSLSRASAASTFPPSASKAKAGGQHCNVTCSRTTVSVGES